MNQSCKMYEKEILLWEKVVQDLEIYILYAGKFYDEGDNIESVPIARVLVARMDVEFFQKNRIVGKTPYEAFMEFILKQVKRVCPCLFLPFYPPFSDGNWEFYVDLESVASIRANEQEKRRLKYLPIVKLYDFIEKIV